MSMSREEVFGIINRERTYQDRKFDPTEPTTCGLLRQQRDLCPAPGILLIEEYALQARKAWVDDRSGDDLPALQQVAKIAAIAVRILEQAGGSERLLRAGLR